MKLVAATLWLCACALHADELSDTFQALKRAEAAQDGAEVLRLALETSRLARLQIAAQPPEEQRDDYQKQRHIYLSQTDTYTEYSLAVAASYPSNTLATTVALTEAVIALNPHSDYLELAVPPYLAALRSLGGEREIEGAQRILKLQPDNEDALLRLAEAQLAGGRLAEASQAAAQLVAVMNAKPRPERYPPEAWSEKRDALTARAHLIAGTAACQRQAWQECDAHLRTIGPQDPNAATAYFYLGWANYHLAGAARDRARIEEALRFSQQAAALGGPLAAAARNNAAALEAELNKR
jgi:hypothetical protein